MYATGEKCRLVIDHCQVLQGIIEINKLYQIQYEIIYTINGPTEMQKQVKSLITWLIHGYTYLRRESVSCGFRASPIET